MWRYKMDVSWDSVETIYLWISYRFVLSFYFVCIEVFDYLDNRLTNFKKLNENKHQLYRCTGKYPARTLGVALLTCANNSRHAQLNVRWTFVITNVRHSKVKSLHNGVHNELVVADHCHIVYRDNQTRAHNDIIGFRFFIHQPEDCNWESMPL